MTRKLTDTLEEYIPTLESKEFTSDETIKEQSEFADKTNLMEALKDFQSDDDNDTDDEYCTVFEVFDYNQGAGLVQIPIELYPLSPMTFHGRDEKAVLLSPTQDRQYIAVRPSNHDVSELIVSELTGLNQVTYCCENVGAIHRGLLEFCLYFLHKLKSVHTASYVVIVIIHYYRYDRGRIVIIRDISNILF